ncbi:uncharacterized protein LOC112559857 isoform X2 [Pomacea canaliculata]|uniref:uncharacterized protein LOC112559857 isoform X2 n=1 Tax=Pomacea canaliculata TaxID=400727 RepID=UPI000D736FBB|nr:uncharacterized protein LOC112559857 isoform X2 [Pomacea canaliculata]
MDKEREERGMIGFTVQFSKDPWPLEKQGEVLRFDKCLSNTHKLYDVATGVFTVPLTGVYHFIVSGMCKSDDIGYSDLVLENINRVPRLPLAHMILKTKESMFVDSQGSDDVDVILHKGDKIVLRHLEGDTVIRGQCHTTYSGTLDCLYSERCPN